MHGSELLLSQTDYALRHRRNTTPYTFTDQTKVNVEPFVDLVYRILSFESFFLPISSREFQRRARPPFLISRARAREIPRVSWKEVEFPRLFIYPLMFICLFTYLSLYLYIFASLAIYVLSVCLFIYLWRVLCDGLIFPCYFLFLSLYLSSFILSYIFNCFTFLFVRVHSYIKHGRYVSVSICTCTFRWIFIYSPSSTFSNEWPGELQRSTLFEQFRLVPFVWKYIFSSPLSRLALSKWQFAFPPKYILRFSKPFAFFSLQFLPSVSMIHAGLRLAMSSEPRLRSRVPRVLKHSFTLRSLERS